MNEYSFNLCFESPYIAHGTAHYSKNWNKAKQDAYNRTYYQEHKEKWGVTSDISDQDQAAINRYARTQRNKAKAYLRSHGISETSKGGKEYLDEVESNIEKNTKKAANAASGKTEQETTSTETKKKSATSSSTSTSKASKKKSSSGSSKKKSSSGSSKSSSSKKSSSDSSKSSAINKYGSTFSSKGSSGSSSGGKAKSSKSSKSTTSTASKAAGSAKTTSEEKKQKAVEAHSREVSSFVDKIVKDGAVNLDDIASDTIEHSTKVLVDLVDRYGEDDITVKDLSTINNLLFKRTGRGD